MSPDSSCYINYIEGSSSSLPIEPPFVVGGNPGYLSVATVYAFNPIPSGLPAAYTNNILGAQCNLWGEYVPSFENVMLKNVPARNRHGRNNLDAKRLNRATTSFTNRLTVEKQRFAQMGSSTTITKAFRQSAWSGRMITTSAINVEHGHYHQRYGCGRN